MSTSAPSHRRDSPGRTEPATASRHWWRRDGRRSRGAAEVGMAVIVAALILGATLGAGLAATDVLTSDGLTWLGDDKRGTAVQINPATGQPQSELKVAPPGDPLDIAQRDGLLVVRDPATGAVTLVDVGSLVTSGQRATAPGDGTEILIDADQLYLVDRSGGTVRRIDPATAADVGDPWSAGSPLADAALDGAGTVWALGVDGQLHALTWSAGRRTLSDASATRRVDGTGPQSVLVPHDSGVTVVAPEGSSIERRGTGSDLMLAAPQLDDQLRAPERSPADLVPVSVPASATVLIVHDNVLSSVSVGQLGCPRPGSPVVHRDRVYVPCLGSGKVLVLDPAGQRAGNDITVAGDPKLVLDDGRLIIHVAGSSSGVLVQADGSTRVIRTHDDQVPPRDPAVPPPPPVVPVAPRRPPPPPTGTQPRTPPGTVAPGTSTAPGTTPPPTVAPRTTPPPTTTPAVRRDPPGNVVAQPRGDGTVLVSWVPAGQADRYAILRGDTSAEVANVPGGATSAIVTTLAPGTTVAILVEADYGGVRVRSAPSAAVQVFTGPGAPGGVSVNLVSAATTTLTVEARWTAAADNGSAVTGYSVTIRSDRGFQQTTRVSGLSSGAVQVGCGTACDGIRVDATVQAINAAGNGPAGAGAYAYTAPPVPVIQEAMCEYSGSGSNFCEVSFDGAASIRWQYQGIDLPSLNDKRYVRIGCGGQSGGRVTVTVTNVSGSDTATAGIRQCSGPIP